MESAERIISQFYHSFQNKDHQGMHACYHPDLSFSEPVFQNLDYKKTCAMWHMLIERGKDLKLQYDNIQNHGDKITCNWEAFYTFSSTGNKVHNLITGTFILEENKIIRHIDHFNFWKWSSMALGTTGTLLGWTSFVRSKVRKTAFNSLEKFIKNHPVYQ